MAIHASKNGKSPITQIIKLIFEMNISGVIYSTLLDQVSAEWIVSRKKNAILCWKGKNK